MKACVVCGGDLIGRQRLLCSPTCKKRRQRAPERYEVSQPEQPEPEKPERDTPSLAGTTAAGDAKQSLEALRQRLAAEIDACDDPKAVATLSARLVDVIDRIAAMSDDKPEGGVLDEFTRRREARRSAGA